MVAVLASVSAEAQTRTTTTQTTTTDGYIQSSKVIGMKVRSSDGQEVGVIKDIVLDRETGCMAYTVLSTGGTVGRATGSAKTVAVPWSVYSAAPNQEYYTARVERERIYNAPAFDYNNIERYSQPAYFSQVYSYYGVQPTFGVGVNINTNTTNVRGGASGSAGQTAPTAAPTGSPAPTATATASPAATATATASPAATATASPKATASPASSPKASPTATAASRSGSSATASPAAKSSTDASGSVREKSTGTSAGGSASTASEAETKAGTTETISGKAAGAADTSVKTGAATKEGESKPSSSPTATP